jgi:hypothetical protein
VDRGRAIATFGIEVYAKLIERRWQKWQFIAEINEFTMNVENSEQWWKVYRGSYLASKANASHDVPDARWEEADANGPGRT